jgi:thiol-disulfide isomerase/thioredoxin
MPKGKTRKVKKTTKSVVKIQKNKDIPKFNSLAGKGVIIVIVTAEWCGACKRIKPELLKSFNTPTNYSRLWVDSEVAKNIPKLNAVSKYPSFLVLKDGSPMDQVGPEGITKELPKTPQTAEEMIEIANNPPSLTATRSMNTRSMNTRSMNTRSMNTRSMMNTSRRKNTFTPTNARPLPQSSNNTGPRNTPVRSLTVEPLSLEKPVVVKNREKSYSPKYVAI